MLFTSPSIATSNNNSNKKQEKNRYETINGKRYYISGEKIFTEDGFYQVDRVMSDEQYIISDDEPEYHNEEKDKDVLKDKIEDKRKETPKSNKHIIGG